MATREKRCPTCGQVIPSLHRFRCEQCGDRFTSRRSDARFCSDRCRVAAHRARAREKRRR